MKKTFFIGLIILLFVGFSSFMAHKFYVSIYQINYAPEKKMLQITSRIFIDDLNAILFKKYHKNTHLGDEKETPEDVVLMTKYILDHFSIKVNGQQKNIRFLSKEVEDNVIIGYYSCKDVSKITTLEVQNTVLMDLVPEQQNIIQGHLLEKKQTLLLTNDNIKGVLK